MANKKITILQHEISYYYDDAQEMPEHEQEHVKGMIIDGYYGGELNCLMYNAGGVDGEWENRGWWQIA